MDDLYNNAWGDSSQFYADTSKPSTSTWVSPSLPTTTHTEEAEADLAAPSWSTGAGIQWNEPSEHEGGFAWSNTEPDLVWGKSTFADIQLGKSEPSEEETDVHDNDHEPTDEDDEDKESVRSPTAHDIPEERPIDKPPSPSPSPSPSPPPPDPRSPSPDVDGFGTFTTAFETDDVVLSAKIAPEIGEEPWGSPWAGAAEEESREEEKPVDQWEIARRQKEKLDRKVPPEVLANILGHCEEYFVALQPAAKEEASNEKDAWMNDWRSGIEGIEGLETLMQSIIPDLTLQPAVQFTKTSIAKQMASTVRITKALPMAKASPMSHYMAAKGSTAWEAAVKQQKLVVEEDVVPTGWRIVEKKPVEAVDSEASNSRQSGFFSFWGRRQSKPVTPTLESAKDSSPSPSRPSLSSRPSSMVGDSAPRASSSRASQDSVRSQPPVKDPLPPQQTSKPEEPAKPSPESTFSSDSPFSSYSNAPEPQVENDPQPQPAPSAVSRFLNRFSRSRSSVGSTSSRRSLALSTDDLEFLSDIVPSASDSHENDPESQRKALADMLKPEPLPPALPPPPLAPPPRPTIVTAAKPSGTSSTSPTTSAGTPQSAIGGLLQTDDGDDFGAFEESPVNSPVAALPQSVIPALPSHFGASTSRTASPSPLSVASTASSAVPGGGQQTPLRPSSNTSLPNLQAPTIQRSSTEPAEPSSKHTMPLRPKIPLSFTLPPPPPASSQRSGTPSPFSPTSDIPLGQLYPGASQKHAPSSSQSAVMSRKPHSLNLPPTSRTHTPTPIMVKAPLNSATQAPLLAPPPLSSVTSATPDLDLFADDDFDDFQSSEPTPAPPTSQPPGFAIPPPPSATTKPSTFAPSLLPPPSFSSPMMASPLSPDPSSSLVADFSSAALLPSSSSLQSDSSRKAGFGGSAPVAKHLLTPKKADLSSDFDDFMGFTTSSALRTPSPPRPPSKTPKVPRIPLSISSPKPVASESSPTKLSSEEKKSQHLRTMSLLERAAARPGQWPAPPSPLPQAISFPVLGAAPQAQDLMGDDESFGAFEAETMKNTSLAPSLLQPPPPVNAPRPAPAAPSVSMGAFAPVPSNSTPPVLTAPSQKSGGGGLSAQDLSFFEGL